MLQQSAGSAQEMPPKLVAVVPPEIERLHFGPEQPSRPVSYDLINIAPQMRDEFDEDDLNELADSIKNVSLLQPIIAYEMPPKLAEWYLGICNQTWGRQVTLEDWKPQENGNYIILAAGERRYRAVGKLIDNESRQPSEVDMEAFVRRCEEPMDLMRVQVAENIHSRPKPYQYAVILNGIYKLGQEIGLYETPEDFIKDAPAGRRTTKRALQFFELPPSVREAVAGEQIGYGHSISLLPYCKAYKEYLDRNGVTDEAELQSLMANMMEVRIGLLMANQWTVSKLEKSIIPTWIDEMAYNQMDMVEFMRGAVDDFATAEHKRILKSKRDVINGAAHSLDGMTKSLAMFRQSGPEFFNGLAPNVKHSLGQLAVTLNQMSEDYIGTSIGETVARLATETTALQTSIPAADEADPNQSSIF